MGTRTSYALGACSTVVVGATSTQSAALTNASLSSRAKSGTFRIVADTNCFIAIGVNPTAAVATGIALPARSVEYIDVPAGQKIAVIQETAAGNLNITAVAEQEG